MQRFNSYIADLAESLVEDKISVLVAGKSAGLEYGVDGRPETLILPEPKDDLDEKTLRLYNGYVDHEVSHVEYTDIDRREEYKVKFADSQVALFVGQIVEDCHIEQKRIKRWKGSAKNLVAVFEQKLWSDYQNDFKNPQSIQDQVNNFVSAAPTFLRAIYGVPGHSEFMDEFKVACPRVIDQIASEFGGQQIENSKQGCEQASRISEILSELYFDEEEDDEVENSGDDEDPEQDDGDQNDDSKPEEDDEQGESEESPADKFEQPGNGDIGEAIEMELNQSDEDDDEEYSVMSRSYDMIGVPILDVIQEHNTLPGDFEKIEVESGRAQLMNAIERKIIGKTNSGWDSGHVSGVIDPKKISRFALGDDRIFRKRSDKEDKSAAAIILIDMSYSMIEQNRHVEAMKAAYSLSSVMDKVGVTCKVMGHTTANCVNKGGIPINYIHYLDLEMAQDYVRIQPLLMPTIKNWSEMTNINKFDMATYPEIYQDNVDGEAVDICCKMLIDRPESKKMLFVISDGMPEAMSGKSESYHLFEEDLKKKINKWRRKILMCSLGVGTNHAGVFFDHHTVSEDANDMTEKLLELFNSMEK